MAETVEIDFVSNIRKAQDGIKTLQQRMKNWGENIEKDMRRMRQVTQVASMGIDLLSDAFNLAGKEAEKLGRVDVASNIKSMKEAGEGLVDVLVQIPVGGRDFLQWMGDAAAGARDLARLVGALSIQFQLTTGIIDQETAEKQINAMMTDEVAVAAQQATEVKKKEEIAIERVTHSQKLLNTELANVKGYKASMEASKDASATIVELRTELKKLQVENGKAAFSEQDLEKMHLDVEDAKLRDKEASRDLWEAEHALTDAIEQGIGDREQAENALTRAQIARERAAIALRESTQAEQDARNAVVDNTNAINEINSRLDDQYHRLRNAAQAAIEYEQALHRIAEISGRVTLTEDRGRFHVPGAGRAAGGPVAAGRSYPVGENGPEIFTPPTSGVITPMSKIDNSKSSVNHWNIVVQKDIDAEELISRMKSVIQYG